MKITKAKEFTNSLFTPPLTSHKESFSPHLTTFVPKVLYTLIKLLQFFWAL